MNEDDLQLRPNIHVKAAHEEMLDGMEIVATSRVRPFQERDVVRVELIGGSMFELRVERPEGMGAVVSYKVEPDSTWHFRLDHIEGQRYQLHMEPQHVEALSRKRGRSATVNEP
jgi:hypothetical protein